MRWWAVATTCVLMIACAPAVGQQPCVGDFFGQVVDAASGKPVQGAWVATPERAVVVRADEAGVFRLNGCFIGTVLSQVQGGGVFGGATVANVESVTVDTVPRGLIVYAPGHKPFCGKVSVLSADVDVRKVVLGRVALAPSDSQIESAEAPMDAIVESSIEPAVVTDPTQGVTVRVTLDTPPDLLRRCRVYALPSVGPAVELKRAKDAGPPGTMSYFEARLGVPNKPDVLELTFGVARENKSAAMRATALDIESPPVTPYTQGYFDFHYSRSGRGDMQRRYCAIAPSASQEQTAQLRKLTEWLASARQPGVNAGARTELNQLPAGPGTLLVDWLPRIAETKDEAQLKALVTELGEKMGPTPEEQPGMVLCQWARVCSALAQASGDDADRRKATGAIEVAAKSARDYGPALRELADFAFAASDYQQAGYLYGVSSVKLGALDGRVGQSLGGGWNGSENHLALRWTGSKVRGQLLSEASKLLARAEKDQAASAWIAVTSALRRAGLPGEAERAARRALKIEEVAAGWSCLGEALSDIDKREDEALEACRKAVALDDKSAPAWYAMGQVLWRTGKRADAVDPFFKAADLVARNTDYRKAADMVKAWNSAQTDKTQLERAALVFFLEQSSIIPDRDIVLKEMVRSAGEGQQSVWVEWILGRLALDERNPDEAEKHFAAAAAIAPDEALFPAERIICGFSRGGVEADPKLKDALAQNWSRAFDPPQGKGQAYSIAMLKERMRRMEMARSIGNVGKSVASTQVSK